MLSFFYRGTGLYGRHPWCKVCYTAWKQARHVPKGPPPPPEGMRRCSGCKEIKPLVEFYRNPAKSKGRANYCKPCHATRTAPSLSRFRKSEKGRQWMRDYSRAYMREYIKRPGEKEKHDLRRLTRYAVQLGLLHPEPCETCDGRDVQAHHESYAKADVSAELSRLIAAALHVRWFCRAHHNETHGGAWGRRTSAMPSTFPAPEGA